jgi:hypothetical protein
MGVGIEVLVVDWPRVEAAPPGLRGALLDEAAFGGETTGGLDEKGWIRPSGADADWHAQYAFRHTLSSYKPHFWACERWEDVRDFATPALRAALDRFTAPLFWHGLEYVAGSDAAVIPERECPWEADLLLWRPPEDIPPLKGHWDAVSPHIESLREPFDRYAADPTGWIPDFDSFAAFLEDWGEVVTEADRRGWGIVGLRC